MGTLAIIQAVVTAASIVYQVKQAEKMKKKMEAAADARKGQKFTVSGSSAPLPVVYGKQRIGGIHCNYKVKSSYPSVSLNSNQQLETSFDNNAKTGSKNEFLAVQTALCHDGIESVKHILVNEIDYRGYTKEMKENKSSFNHRFHIHTTGGTSDATATAFGFPSTNNFSGCAHVSNFFKLNRDEPQYSGIPSMAYIVKGRKVRAVTRSGSSESGYTYSLNSSYTYSNNPSLCLLDYLLNNDFGRGLTTNDVDLESFYNAADICDTPVLTGATIGGEVNDVKPIFSYTSQNDFPTTDIEPYMAGYLYYDETNDNLYTQTQSGSTPNITASYTLTTAPATDTISLYECNITLSTEETIRNNIERILNTMGLSDLVWTPQGKYKLILSYPQTQSQQDALITHTFDEDNIVRESVKLVFPKAQDRFNQVTVSFDNEFENFKDDTFTWPPTNSSVHQTYLTEDNNQPLTTSLQGDGVTSKYHAQALAEQQVRKSRYLYTITFSINKEGLTVEPGDIIKVNMPTMSISNEIFRVESIKVNSDFSVDISAFRFDFNILAWNVPNDLSYVVRPDFDFKVGVPTSLTFSNTSDITGTASGKLSWTAADDASVVEYIIEAQRVGTVWTNSGNYVIGDMVRYNNQNYVAKTNNSNSTPSASSSDWDIADFQTLGTSVTNSFDITGLKTGDYTFSVRSRNITGLKSERVELSNQSLTLITVSRVAIIYADSVNAASNSQSYTFSVNKPFVAYYVYNSDLPTLPITSGITFTRFIGINSKAISVGATSQTFTFNSQGAATPSNQSITLTAALQNTTDTNATFTTSPSVTLTGTGNTRTLTSANFGTNDSVTITVTADSNVSDSITIYRLQDAVSGTSVNVQYSADDSTYTDAIPSGVKYIRYGTKADGANSFTYAAGVKYVPEEGIEYTVEDGDNAYLHIKYSNDNGTTFTGNNGEDVGTYIGTYSDNTAADSTTIGDYTWVQIEGSGGLTAILSNESHTLTAPNSGNPTIFTGSGTLISVFEGTTQLDYDGTGTANGHFTVTAAATGCTVGAISDSTNNASVAALTAMTADTASITFTITGKTLLGESFTITKTQSFSLSRLGDTGITGASTNIVFQRSATALTTAPTDSDITSSGPWYDNADDATGTGLLYAANGAKAAGATSFTWSDPFRVEGEAVAEIVIYRLNSNAGHAPATSPTYNFTNDTLTHPTSGWSRSAPALGSDGDIVYRSSGVASGSALETAAEVTFGTPVIYAQRTDGRSITGVSKSGETVTVTYDSGSDDTFTVNGISSVAKSGDTLTVTFDDNSTATVDDGIGIDSITKSGETVTVTYDQPDSNGNTITNTFTVADGLEGDGLARIYIASENKPTTPSASSGIPTGWSTTLPTKVKNIWASDGSRTNNTGNYTWGEPQLLSEITANTLLNQGFIPWTAGTGDNTVGGGLWDSTGETSENIREVDTDPFGGESIIWKSVNKDTSSAHDGGFYGPATEIDSTKLHRLSVFIKQENFENPTSTTTGGRYWGVYNRIAGGSARNITRSTDGVSTGNPYFKSNFDLPQNDRWYLLVSHVNPYQSSGYVNTVHPDSGLWDAETGEKVLTGFADYTITDSSLAAVADLRMRAFYYNDNSAIENKVLWFDPRIDTLDGAAPSISEILRKNPIPVTGTIIPVTSQTINKDVDNSTYSAGHLDFDAVFYQGTDIVAKRRYRVARSSDSWSTSVTTRDGDITDELNTSRLSSVASVSLKSAILEIDYNYLNSISKITASMSIVLDGEQGISGTPAKSVQITANSQVFTFDKNVDTSNNAIPVPSSQTITFTAKLQNTTGSATFTAVDENGTNVISNLTGTGNTRSLTAANFGNAEKYIVTATADGISDSITIHKIKEGSDAITAVLSNETHTIPCYPSGVGISYAGSGTEIRLYQGNTLLTPVASNQGNGEYRITVSSAGFFESNTPATHPQTSDITISGNIATMPDVSHLEARAPETLIQYSFNGYTNEGVWFNFSKTQKFIRSIEFSPRHSSIRYDDYYLKASSYPNNNPLNFSNWGFNGQTGYSTGGQYAAFNTGTGGSVTLNQPSNNFLYTLGSLTFNNATDAIGDPIHEASHLFLITPSEEEQTSHDKYHSITTLKQDDQIAIIREGIKVVFDVVNVDYVSYSTDADISRYVALIEFSYNSNESGPGATTVDFPGSADPNPIDIVLHHELKGNSGSDGTIVSINGSDIFLDPSDITTDFTTNTDAVQAKLNRAFLKANYLPLPSIATPTSAEYDAASNADLSQAMLIIPKDSNVFNRFVLKNNNTNANTSNNEFTISNVSAFLADPSFTIQNGYRPANDTRVFYEKSSDNSVQELGLNDFIAVNSPTSTIRLSDQFILNNIITANDKVTIDTIHHTTRKWQTRLASSDWVFNTVYAKGDLISYNSNTYIATDDISSGTSNPSSNSNWSVYNSNVWTDDAIVFEQPIVSELLISREAIIQHLSALKIDVTQLNINDMVEFGQGGGYKVNKTSPDDDTNGIFLGNPLPSGTGSSAVDLEFALATKGDKEINSTTFKHGVKFTAKETILENPTIKQGEKTGYTGNVLSSTASHATSGTNFNSSGGTETISGDTWNYVKIDPNAIEVSVEAIGGGGGGAGEANSSHNPGSAGTQSNFILVARTTTGGSFSDYTSIISSTTCLGGAGATGPGVDTFRGDPGQASIYAAGGYGGGSTSAGGNGSQGSGGGGRGGRSPDWDASSRKGGAGGRAGAQVTADSEVLSVGGNDTTLADNTGNPKFSSGEIRLYYRIGSGGVGGSGGGTGGDGLLKYSVTTVGANEVLLNPFGTRAWVNFVGNGSDATNATINGSSNIASVYKIASGRYTATFVTPMPNANYAITYAGSVATGYSPSVGTCIDVYSMSSTAFSFNISDPTGNNYANPRKVMLTVVV